MIVDDYVSMKVNMKAEIFNQVYSVQKARQTKMLMHQCIYIE